MRVKVLLFASLRAIVGGRQVEIELPDGATVGALYEHLAAANPALTERRAHIMIAVNGERQGDDHVLTDGAEVALLPPVSGGRGDD